MDKINRRRSGYHRRRRLTVEPIAKKIVLFGRRPWWLREGYMFFAFRCPEYVHGFAVMALELQKVNFRIANVEALLELRIAEQRGQRDVGQQSWFGTGDPALLQQAVNIGPAIDPLAVHRVTKEGFDAGHFAQARRTH